MAGLSFTLEVASITSSANERAAPQLEWRPTTRSVAPDVHDAVLDCGSTPLLFSVQQGAWDTTGLIIGLIIVVVSLIDYGSAWLRRRLV